MIRCIEKNAKERRLWLLFAYMVRSCVLPSKEFSSLDLNVIRTCCSQFYKLFELLFSSQNCTYNLHVVCCHLLDIRYEGPLTLNSAFVFENFYGELRNSFTPGTKSPLKQIMEKVIMKRALSQHCCEPSIYYSNYETVLECNNLVYTYRFQQYKFFKIIDISDTEEKTFTCLEITTEKPKFVETPSLAFEKIGVVIEKEMLETQIKLKQNEICGKVIRIVPYLLTCPINVLEEK